MDSGIVVYIDGASRGNPGDAGCGVVVYGVEKEPMRFGKYLGHATNNVAEYNALIFALEKLIELDIKKVKILSDSQLLVSQVNGDYAVKDTNLKKLFRVYLGLMVKFDSITVKHIPRELNREADKLANFAINTKAG